MKLQDLTIDQFQRIGAIEFSSVLGDYDKRAGVVAIVEGVDISLVREMSAKAVLKRYKAIISEWNALPALGYKRKFKAGGKWWIPTVFTDELTAGQLIELMDANTTDEKQLLQNLHRIMATLCREGGLFGFFPKKYDGAAHAERAELMKKHAKVGDVWGVVSFFLLSSESYLKVLSDYSKHLMTMMVVWRMANKDVLKFDAIFAMKAVEFLTYALLIHDILEAERMEAERARRR